MIFWGKSWEKMWRWKLGHFYLQAGTSCFQLISENVGLSLTGFICPSACSVFWAGLLLCVLSFTLCVNGCMWYCLSANAHHTIGDSVTGKHQTHQVGYYTWYLLVKVNMNRKSNVCVTNLWISSGSFILLVCHPVIRNSLNLSQNSS